LNEARAHQAGAEEGDGGHGRAPICWTVAFI